VLVNAHGLPLRKQVQSLTRAQVKALIDLDPLLRSLGLSLYCVNCQRLGLPDGVQGDNDPNALTLKVTCSCTDRVFSTSR
jgi:hypothetical protein